MAVPLVPLWTVPAEPVSLDAYPTLDLGVVPSAAIRDMLTQGCAQGTTLSRRQLRRLLEQMQDGD